MNKTKIQCNKCEREITSNNFQRHYDACSGNIQKKVRGVDFDPNWGYNVGIRQAWNKGLKIGPNESLIEHYNNLRKSKNTEEFSSRDAIRRKVLEEQNYRCNRCNIDEWLGQKITLELEHIDGKKSNNERSNLEGLCPNCHSLTLTWRGRNRNLQARPSGEALS